MLVQFRDPRLSLWQSAIDETLHQAQPGWTLRPSMAVDDKAGAILREVARHCEAMTSKLSLDHLLSAEPAFAKFLHLPASSTVHEKVAYCSALYLSKAKALASSEATNLANIQNELKFGDCDPSYGEAVEKYVEYFKLRRQAIPYVAPPPAGDTRFTDFAVENIGNTCTVALVGDWGTGQEPAKMVLQRIAYHNPDYIIHLGDIYYSGTIYEAENYFLNIFKQVYPNKSFTPGTTPRVLTMAGNHDMYAGGSGYYWLLQRLGQPASFFCLRNANWQFVGIDTGYADHDPGTVNTIEPGIHDQELQWLKTQVDSGKGCKTILLSHHPLFSAFDSINNQAVNNTLKKQIIDLLPKITAWYWAHEHNLVIYREWQNIHARLVGHGAFPVGIPEITSPKHTEVPYFQNVTLGNDGTCYNHGYVIVQLNGAQGQADYYECAGPKDQIIHTEQLQHLP
jgi:hypothetical protein